MPRALVLASVFALTASVALAQPQGGAGGYGAQPPTQGGYPMPSQDAQPSGADGGYGQGGGYGQQSQGGYDQGGSQGGQGGGGRWAADPQMHALRKTMRAACATDLATYCTDARQGGHGAMHQCITANQARFTPACQSAIGQVQAYKAQARGQAAGGYAPPQGGYPPPQ